MLSLDFNDINYKLINRVKLFQLSLTSLQNVHFSLTLNKDPHVTFQWPWRIHKSEISLMVEHRQNWSTVRTTLSTWLNVFSFREVQLRKLCHPLPPLKPVTLLLPLQVPREKTPRVPPTSTPPPPPRSRGNALSLQTKPPWAYNSRYVTFNCRPLHPSNADRKQAGLNKC